MPKQTNSRSRVRPRSILKFCQEHTVCSQEQPNRAEYHCVNCQTYQCEGCCSVLHQSFENHEPTRLDPPDPSLLCVTENCSNYADFHCSFCQPLESGAKLCVSCDRKLHSGLAYSHRRLPIEQFRREQDAHKQKVEEKARPNPSKEKAHYYDWNQTSSVETPLCDLQFPRETESRIHCENSSENSLEDQFYTIRDDNQAHHLPEMRPSHSTSNRGRVLRPDRQNASDSSVMKTMELDGYVSSSSQSAGVHLIDDEENLLVHNAEQFLSSLKMSEDESVKVVSIFGNTGVGKSHTLNNIFFRGEKVFSESASQESCTYGVWAAYDCRLQCLVIDTEGFLGLTKNEARRRRLLLKVLGISDVVIYRTNAPRLENDMFYFLHDASKAFEDYFAAEFKAIMSSTSTDTPVTNMSPVIIIFHETKHTKPLSDKSHEAISQLNRRAKEMKLSLSAFPGMMYVGVQTTKGVDTDFKPLERIIQQSLSDRQCERISRPASVVYEVLSQLNKKYSGEIPEEDVIAFSSKYFSCRSSCKSCGQRCELSLNHDESQHQCKEGCKYRSDIGNRVFMCRICLQNGEEQLVRWQTCTSQENGFMGMMMFLKRGYIIECPKHGIIYRSFEQWYNNPPPEAHATVIRMVHVWPGDIPLSADGTPGHVGQRIVDISNSVTQVVSPSLQVASEWVTDQVAPEYWTPNASAQVCKICNVKLGEKLAKHHCRRCGECVCEHCSPNRMHLPSWGVRPVRVCRPCYERPLSGPPFEARRSTDSQSDSRPSNVDAASDEQLQVTARVVTETMGQAAGVLSSVFKQSANLVKDWVRPDYWKPDADLIECSICEVPFGPTEDKELQLKHGADVKRHHCRRCGDGFCAFCSSNRLPVPSRGWESPVRVCDRCAKSPSPL